jgi:trans-AT polyketide synthase/acyltransferase/oxidoreductase domain-containing protein
VNQMEPPINSHGCWTPEGLLPATGRQAVSEAIHHLGLPVYLVNVDGRIGVAHDGIATLGPVTVPASGSYRLLGWAPPLSLESLGDPGFKSDHGLRFAYICGAMANGITSTAMVKRPVKSGMIAFFGAGGLSIEQVDIGHRTPRPASPTAPYGFNLIHSPKDMDLELKTVVELYLENGVSCISASAYLDLTLPLVLYRVNGIHRMIRGEIVCPNKIIAKVSREEVARKFFWPRPGPNIFNELLPAGKNHRHQAELARTGIPWRRTLTAEADSGGHTDNRPALCLLPTMKALRERDDPSVRLTASTCGWGLAGGIATPESAAAAFAMGAAYILTGSINQSCVEADTSPLVKKMLAEARQADVIMAPAADMFEMGVKVQVLKRGTMFSMRAAKLYDHLPDLRPLRGCAPEPA